MSLMFKVYRHQLLIQSHAMNFVNYHEIFALIILDMIFNNPRAMFCYELISRYFRIWYFNDEVTILPQLWQSVNYMNASMNIFFTVLFEEK